MRQAAIKVNLIEMSVFYGNESISKTLPCLILLMGKAINLGKGSNLNWIE